MRLGLLSTAVVLAILNQACVHRASEVRYFGLQSTDQDDRIRLFDASRRLLISTRDCNFAVRPAYAAPTLLIWIEEDPARPCGRLTLLNVSAFGRGLGGVFNYASADDQSIDSGLPISFRTRAEISFQTAWAGVPDEQRKVEANLAIEVRGEVLEVSFRTLLIEPKWIGARPYWKGRSINKKSS